MDEIKVTLTGSAARLLKHVEGLFEPGTTPETILKQALMAMLQARVEKLRQAGHEIHWLQAKGFGLLLDTAQLERVQKERDRLAALLRTVDVEDPITNGWGMFRGSNLTQELLDERRRERGAE
ncbi:MAG TPA: hypothetical protein VD969_29075 [Symbiobacteriaceae bacterium]|nr:hypothetical protein [Symbiobacteriaceae bacterium]